MPHKYARRLYQSILLPRISYGMVVWFEPVHDHPAASEGRQRGAIGMQRRLSKIHNRATRLITGAFKSTPTDLLDYHAGLPPFALTLQRLAFSAAIRLTSLPYDHPLYKPTQRAARYEPRFHLTTTHHLLRAFPQLRNIEQIDPAFTQIPTRSCVTTSIADSRDDAVQQHNSPGRAMVIYTDGSVGQEHAGAAAVCPQGTSGATVRHIYLGSSTNRSTLEAELAGICAGINLILSNHRHMRVTIFTDSQQAVAAIQKPRPKPGQQVVQRLHQELARLRHLRPGLHLHITWILGHSNIAGNDEAHRQAKRAARHKLTSDSLQPLSFTDLPTSITAIRREYASTFKAEWRQHWANSTAGQRIRNIDSTEPGTKFANILSNLTRPAASLIVQLRTRHIALNGFLARIKAVDSPLCQRCQEPESIPHFLFRCRRYTLERLTLRTTVNHTRFDMAAVLGNPKAFPHLYQFLIDTDRFPYYTNPGQ